MKESPLLSRSKTQISQEEKKPVHTSMSDLMKKPQNQSLEEMIAEDLSNSQEIAAEYRKFSEGLSAGNSKQKLTFPASSLSDLSRSFENLGLVPSMSYYNNKITLLI